MFRLSCQVANLISSYLSGTRIGTLGAPPPRQGRSAVPGAAAEHAASLRLTCVATWTGFVRVAFVIDADERRVVVHAPRAAHAGFVLDALEQALRRPLQSESGVFGCFTRSPRSPKCSEVDSARWIRYILAASYFRIGNAGAPKWNVQLALGIPNLHGSQVRKRLLNQCHSPISLPFCAID